MSIILIIFCIWGASALARATKEAARKKEIERQRREQAARSAELARMTAEWKQRQEEAKIETARLIALEREQMRQAKEQEKLAKEQEKYEARLAKVEAEQRKMRFEIDQINEDLPLLHRQLDTFMEQMDEWQNRLHKAQLDLEWDELRMREAPSAVKGKEHDAHLKAKATAESKIISLEKNIRKAEKQIATAEFKKGEYTRKLEVA